MYHSGPVVSVTIPEPYPSNSFINWLLEKYNDESITFDVKYSEEKSVSKVISYSDITRWRKPEEPIFISAQTGYGKSSFIREVLIKNILFNKEKLHKRVLILSNRVALNRQSKLSYAETIFKITGNREVLQKIEDFYTFKGFDKFCLQFDECLTICSYHQLLERKLLDENYYDYIVCDEAHFFVEDALFNHHTDEMLRYITTKGKNSIRIYMSATLNIAMEAILKEEYKMIEERNKDLDYFQFHNSLNLWNIYNSKPDKLHLNCRIYFFARDYSFIKNIYKFNNLNALISAIGRSNTKWIIFVKSVHDGEYLEKYIYSSKSRLFLSRERIDKIPEVAKAYDDIILNQTFKEDVLITTPVLDNGINILQDSSNPITNIVIFSFHQPQFLQMLGRLRNTVPNSINLFLYDASIETIKHYMTSTVDSLISRLQIDLLDSKEEKEKYNPKYHKINDLGNVEYNDYSIMHLISKATLFIYLYSFLEFNNKSSIDEIHCSSTDLEESKNLIMYNFLNKWWDNSHSGILYSLIKRPDTVHDEYLNFEQFFYHELLNRWFISYFRKISSKLIHLIDNEKLRSTFYEFQAFSKNDLSPYQYHNLYDTALGHLEKSGYKVEIPLVEHYRYTHEYYYDNHSLDNLGMSCIDTYLLWLSTPTNTQEREVFDITEYEPK